MWKCLALVIAALVGVCIGTTLAYGKARLSAAIPAEKSLKRTEQNTGKERAQNDRERLMDYDFSGLLSSTALVRELVGCLAASAGLRTPNEVHSDERTVRDRSTILFTNYSTKAVD